MADPYKPDEAVIVFVQGPAGTADANTIFRCNKLEGTYFGVSSPSTLDFMKGDLTRDKIPWDNRGQAVGDMNGYGVRVPDPALAGVAGISTGVQALAANGAPTLQIIVSKQTGAWYAVGPNTFFWLRNFDEVNALRAAGVLSKTQVVQDDAAISWTRTCLMRPIEALYVAGATAKADVSTPDMSKG